MTQFGEAGVALNVCWLPPLTMIPIERVNGEIVAGCRGTRVVSAAARDTDLHAHGNAFAGRLFQGRCRARGSGRARTGERRRRRKELRCGASGE